MQIRYELDEAICIRSCARLRGVEGQNVEMSDYRGSKSNLSPVFGNVLKTVSRASDAAKFTQLQRKTRPILGLNPCPHLHPCRY